MVGAKEQLAAHLGQGFSMNAKVGRQVDEVIALARQLKAAGHHPNDLIIQIGDNGPLYSEEMDALRTATSEAGHVFLINDHAPVSWIGESNEKLSQAAKEWPAHLADRLERSGQDRARPVLGRDPPHPRRRGLLRAPDRRRRPRRSAIKR